MAELRMLHSVEGWTSDIGCTATALSAATGIALSEILSALAATAGGSTSDIIRSVPTSVWGQTLKALGFDWITIRDRSFPEQSIDDFMASNHESSVVLVIATDDDAGVGHVFAAQQQHFVDCHTFGRVQEFKSTPSDLQSLRVRHVLLLRRNERQPVEVCIPIGSTK